MIQDRPLYEAGGKGLFTKEIEQALLAGVIDLAVHSAKDVPTFLPDGLWLSAWLPREDPRDVFVSPHGGDPEHAAAGLRGRHVRRRAAARWWRGLRPDLKLVSLRGNVETRLRKIAEGEADATILALAGLKRLGLQDRATAIFDPHEFLAGGRAGRDRDRSAARRRRDQRVRRRRSTTRTPRSRSPPSAVSLRCSTARAARRSPRTATSTANASTFAA